MMQGVLKQFLKFGQKPHFGRNFGQNLCFGENKNLVFGQHIPWVPNHVYKLRMRYSICTTGSGYQ